MPSFQFWQKWLFTVALLIVVFGILLALLNGTILFKEYNRQIDPVFWGSSDVPPHAKAFQQWICGVLGATVAGWGTLLAFVAHFGFSKKERWAWNGIAAGLLLWFAIDTPVSLFFKVYFNALFNTAVFVAVLLPLLFTKKDFTQ